MLRHGGDWRHGAIVPAWNLQFKHDARADLGNHALDERYV